MSNCPGLRMSGGSPGTDATIPATVRLDPSTLRTDGHKRSRPCRDVAGGHRGKPAGADGNATVPTDQSKAPTASRQTCAASTAACRVRRVLRPSSRACPQRLIVLQSEVTIRLNLFCDSSSAAGPGGAVPCSRIPRCASQADVSGIVQSKARSVSTAVHAHDQTVPIATSWTAASFRI